MSKEWFAPPGKDPEQFCLACFTGKYPLPVDPELDKFIMEKREAAPKRWRRKSSRPCSRAEVIDERPSFESSRDPSNLRSAPTFARIASRLVREILASLRSLESRKKLTPAPASTSISATASSAESSTASGARTVPRCSGRSAASAACFAPNFSGMREPVLVASVDGVGTKLKIAFAMNRHDTVGADLVNHCVNDIAVLGARPLFFLDYIGAEKLEPQVFDQILRGFTKACRAGGLRLDRRRNGADAGDVSQGRIRSGGLHRRRGRSAADDRRHRESRPGDVILGLPSNGLHTNGYSLARKIFFEQMRLKPPTEAPGLAACR